MKVISLLFVLGVISSTAFSATKVVNSYFAKDSFWVQVEDSQTKTLEWHSATKVGIANTTLGCTGTNCVATNLQIKNKSVFGDIFVLFEKEPSFKNVFITDLQENNQINPAALGFVNHHGENVIVVYINNL